MIIVTILGTGIRRGELIGLKWSDIDFENLSISIFGKTRRRETLPLTIKLTKEFSAYKTYCRQHCGKENEYVFTKRDYTRLTDNSIILIFKYLRQKMNFPNVRVSAQTFRHCYCHRLAMSGMSAFGIQKLMRHQNITVTMKYVAMWGNELREQNDRFNPLNELEI
jgi:integrase/recombinase XerD